jgi:methyltransferase (TIGR00027 family)
LTTDKQRNGRPQSGTRGDATRGSGEQWDIVTGVGLTALAVAAARAAETEREDALVTDPYAAALVAAAEAPVPFPSSVDDARLEDGQGEMWQGVIDYIAVRSCVFDDFYREAASDGVTQAVILASGLDTRPYRLDWPAGTVVYELDQPAVLEFKLDTLATEGAAPQCEHRPVPVDLRDDWGAALEAAGFDASRPTAWLAEGLLQYLPPEAEVRLLAEVTRLSAPKSRCAVERIEDVPGMVGEQVMRQRVERSGTDFDSLFPKGERTPATAQLAALGWELEHRDIPGPAVERGREVSGPDALADVVTHTFGRLD